MFAKFIKPELYNDAPKKKKEIQELKENAFQAIKKLKTKGHCNEITHNQSFQLTANAAS